VGIDTAFITIPGHIFMAFALKLPPSEVQRTFQDPEDIIVFDDSAWVPVEVTKVNSSFLEAWKTGAIEWSKNAAKDSAKFYPLSDSWKVYEPVGYVGEDMDISFIPMVDVKPVYAKEMNRFIDRELYGRMSALEGRLKQSSRKYVILNKLGIVQAQFGRIDKARSYFNEALKIIKYSPSLLNLGNISYMEGDLSKALSYYGQVEKLKPDSTSMLVQLARIYNDMGDFTSSELYYKKLKSRNPELAAHYAYLDLSQPGSGRASKQSSGKEVMVWDE